MRRNSSRQARHQRRSGKTLVIFALLLPALLSFAGLIIDGSLILGEQRHLQHLADAAAKAAARVRMDGGSSSEQLAAANRIMELNNLTDATLTLQSTPASGPYAGDSDYLEVEVTHTFEPHLFNLMGDKTVRARAVAGIAPASDRPAIVLLGSNPSLHSIPAIGSVPSLAAPSAALQVEGSGNFHVHNTIIVNSTWGAVDGDGQPAGSGAGSPWAIAHTGTGTIDSTYVYTGGGVDSPQHYRSIITTTPNGTASQTLSETPRILANRRAVSDPWSGLPYPTTEGMVDRGSFSIDDDDDTELLQPGLYDWIRITDGTVVFSPGIYIIRGVHPTTGVGLHVTGGTVKARGVMFFFQQQYDDDVTDVAGAVLDLGSGTHEFTGLDAPDSVFNAMTIFQHRSDSRPIILVNQSGTSGRFEGAIYGKSAAVVLIGRGNVDAAIVADSLRAVLSGDLMMHPEWKPNHRVLEPAKDVYLVQ